MTSFSAADKEWLQNTFNEILNKKISELQTTINKIKEDYDLVVTENNALRNELKSVRIQHDDLEQYGRRYAIRLEGLEYSDGETNEQCRRKSKQNSAYSASKSKILTSSAFTVHPNSSM